MKVLVIQLEESVDISLLPKGKKVIVTDGLINHPGEVMFSADMLDPPGLDGLYTISRVETPPVEP